MSERSVYKFPNAGIEIEGTVYENGYLSPSQVGSMVSCGACYEAERILRIPKATGIHFAIGNFAHKATEALGRRIIAGEKADHEEALAAGEDYWTKQTTIPVDDETGVELIIDLGKHESLGKAKDEAARFAKFALTEMEVRYRERGLLAVEYNLRNLPEEVKSDAFPFVMEGRVDALYGGADGAVSAGSDLKTSASQQPPDGLNRLQASLYGYFFHVAGQPVPWAIDVLGKKVTPDFVTYWLEPTPEEYAYAHKVAMDAAEDICAGRFRLGFGWNGKHDYQHGVAESRRSYTVAA